MMLYAGRDMSADTTCPDPSTWRARSESDVVPSAHAGVVWVKDNEKHEAVLWLAVAFVQACESAGLASESASAYLKLVEAVRNIAPGTPR